MATGKLSLRDARALLGVAPTATRAQVTSAFRRQAKALHPDVNTIRSAATRFDALVAAYEVALPATPRETTADVGPATTTRPSTPSSQHRLDPVDPGCGATAVWEAGRPLLMVGPVIVHSRPAASGGGRQSGDRGKL